MGASNSSAVASPAPCRKAKLEAVESEITTFEEEFLAHILLPDGQTAGDYLLPQLERVYETGKMPTMLPMLAKHED